MKRISKLRLINWQSFVDQEIVFKNNIVVITGQNGVGKTSLLDALEYLLLGGNDYSFNSAANKKSSRSVKSYIRGKIGSEENSNLREGDILSHIAIEIVNDKTLKTSVLGVVFELTSLNNLKETFYRVKNAPLIEGAYSLDSGKILNFDELKEVYEEHDFRVEEIKGNKQEIYDKIVTNDFYLKKNYSNLINKSMGFEPIDNIDDFIYSFLMEEEKIDLDSLKNKARTYQELKLKVEACNKKILALKDIENNYQLYKENEEKIKDLDIVDTLKEYNLNLDKLNKENEKFNELNASKKSENFKKLDISNKVKELAETVLKLENSETYKEIKDLEKKNENKEVELNKIRNILSNFNSFYLDLTSSLDKVNTLLDKTLIDYSSLKSSYMSFSFKGVSSALSEIKSKLVENYSYLDKEYNDLDEEIKDKENELDLLKKEANRLNNEKMTYSYEISSFRDLLNEKLSSKSGFTCSPLCELIEINDESYRDAIEGNLNNRRFDLIVPPLYFKECYEILRDNRENYPSVSLVNISAIKDKQKDPASLASVISTSNAYARKYVDYLLGDVFLNDKEFDFSKNETTSDAFIYKKGRLNKVNPRLYTRYYIGKKAILDRLKEVKEEISDLNKDLSELKVERNNFDFSRNILRTLNSKFVFSFDEDYFTLEHNLANDIESIKKEISKLKESDLSTLSTDIDEKRRIKSEAEKEIDNIETNLAKINSDLGKSGTIIEELNSLISQDKSKLKEYFEDSLYKAKIDLMLKEDLDRSKLDQNIRNSRYEVESGMKEYNKEFNYEENPDVSNISPYLELLRNYENNDLNEFKVKCEEAREEAYELYKEKYINSLATKIDNKKRDISEINRKLSSLIFGLKKEIYRIEVSKANSKDETFQNIYEIVESNQNYEGNFSVFYNSLSTKNRDTLEKVFDLISQESPNNDALKKINEYCDYRNFMSYDIKISSAISPSITYFSKVSRERSGGEIQNPFYIIIAACFLNSIIRKDDSLCPILFDEAFNNMDPGRIETLLKFYKELDLNIFIVVPPSNVTSLLDEVDDVIALNLVKDKYIAVQYLNEFNF